VERSGLLRLVKELVGRAASSAAGAGADAAEWARDAAANGIADTLDELRGAVHYSQELRPRTHVLRFLHALKDWYDARATCTPKSTPQPKLQERHIAVLVAGLGSSSENGAVYEVDTGALGYAAGDVAKFSYNGGTTADNKYKPTDTTQDIHQSARRLRELLERLEAEHPGVPIDIIAHSQGGIVARTALTDEVDGADPRLPQVASLVTLGSPNQGAPGATGLTMFGHTTTGEVAETLAHVAAPNVVDPGGTSIQQMAEESEFMQRLNNRPLPAGLKATSIGARGDLIVPAGVTRLDGANNVIVSVPGYLTEHTELPASTQAQREIALALSGMTPTCEGLADAMADAGVSDLIRSGEDVGGAALWVGGHLVDDKIPTPTVPTRYES
jgi:palmitoyl protein thioesterase